MDRIASRVADRQTMLAAIIQINVVYSGSSDGNQFEFRQAGKHSLAQGKLVSNRDGGVLKSFNHVGGICLAIIDPFMIKVRPAKPGPESIPLQKDNPFHK